LHFCGRTFELAACAVAMKLVEGMVFRRSHETEKKGLVPFEQRSRNCKKPTTTEKMNETTETKKVIITSKPIADSVVATAEKILISLVAGTGATPLNPGNPIYEAFEYARMFHDKAAEYLAAERQKTQQE
jgi:hypothetical protein